MPDVNQLIANDPNIAPGFREMFAAPETDPWAKGHMALIFAGNQFAVLSFLQHAQIHLMRAVGGTNGLCVSLDGDYQAILTLHTAENDFLREAMDRQFKCGYDLALAQNFREAKCSSL